MSVISEFVLVRIVDFTRLQECWGYLEGSTSDVWRAVLVSSKNARGILEDSTSHTEAVLAVSGGQY